jgi:putative acyl-CoA dehydrogenase
MPRYFREAPVNAIWEGSGNVIALDILRTLGKEPAALEAYMAELEPARAANADFARTFETIGAAIRSGLPEAGARQIAETMALALQAALLLRHGAPEVAAAFCSLRLGAARGVNYGAGGPVSGADTIVARQTGRS